jgi:predicted HicB family RNase H-like nuclease
MNKTIVIENETHNQLKNYCKENSIKLNSWVNNLIKRELNRVNK